VSAIETASSLERAEKCPVSFALPQIHTEDEDAARGHVIHAFLRRIIDGVGVEEALKHVDEDNRDTCRGVELPKIIGDFASVRTEVAYALDVDTLTVRELGRNIGRDYAGAAKKLGAPLKPSEIPGTCDVEGVTKRKLVVTGDFKTGYKPLAPIIAHRQTHFHAVVQRILHDVDEVEGRLWRIDESGAAYLDRHVFDAFALDDLVDDIVTIHEGVVRARNEFQEEGFIAVTPGKYCQHCPSMPVCPAYVELARACVTQAGTIVASLTKLTPEQKWNAWQFAKQGETLLKSVRKALSPMIRQEPFLSPDGQKQIALVSYPKVDFSQTLALALIRELGGSEDQIKSCFVPKQIESFREVNAPGAKKKKKPANAAKPKEFNESVPSLPPSSLSTEPSRAELRDDRE
jgi:hypothetical protein